MKRRVLFVVHPGRSNRGHEAALRALAAFHPGLLVTCLPAMDDNDECPGHVCGWPGSPELAGDECPSHVASPSSSPATPCATLGTPSGLASHWGELWGAAVSSPLARTPQPGATCDYEVCAALVREEQQAGAPFWHGPTT